MTSFEDIISIIYGIQDKALLEDFLHGLTTEKERQEFARRVEITQRILAGEAHKKIAAELGVGVATVTRGSKEITQGRFKVLQKPKSPTV